MSDLLEQLGKVDRDDRLPEDWDEVLDGRRDAQDVIRQRKAEGDDEALLEALARASAPLRESERQAWTRRVRAGLREASEDEDAEEHPRPAAVDDPSPDNGTSPEPEPIDLERHRAKRRRLGGVLAVTAAAAMTLLWMRPSTDPGPGSPGDPLPSFSLEVRSASVHSMRGDDAPEAEGPEVVEPNTVIHWMVQPEEPVEASLELAAVVRGEQGVECLARPRVKRASGNGVLEVRGAVQDTLGLAAGRWTLDLLVAHVGTLPDDRGGTECAQPRVLPCPCPADLRPGATIEPAVFDDDAGPARWRVVESYAIDVQST